MNKKKVKLKNNLDLTPKFLNGLLYSILWFENKLYLPNGVTIVGVCKK